MEEIDYKFVRKPNGALELLVMVRNDDRKLSFGVNGSSGYKQSFPNGNAEEGVAPVMVYVREGVSNPANPDVLEFPIPGTIKDETHVETLTIYAVEQIAGVDEERRKRRKTNVTVSQGGGGGIVNNR